MRPKTRTPEQEYETQEREELVHSMLKGLPEDQRTVISLRYLVGLSEHETAGALGLPAGTVKSRTARALERLRESYD